MRFVLFAVLLALVSVPLVAVPGTAAAADCRFVMGFKTLHDLIPSIVADCLVNEHRNPRNGDSLQETARGLLAWRKADNHTAFTDGYRTWVNGPLGMHVRLNTERFPWEKDETRRLVTGTLVRAGATTGLGELAVANGRDLDAVAVLAGPNRVPMATVYVQAGDSFTLTGIDPGTYELYFTTGEDWDSDSARFTRKSSFFRFEDTLTFRTTPTTRGIQYNTFRVTLHGVLGGTARTTTVDARQFPALR